MSDLDVRDFTTRLQVDSGGFSSRGGSSLEARSVENPSTPLSAGADWMYDVLGAIKSASGIRVNRKTAFTYSPIWRGINLLARDTAKLPLSVYRLSGDRDDAKEPDKEHPAYYLLRRKPNREQTAHAWKMLTMAHAILEGNGYSYIARRGDGTPTEIVPLLPDRTYPVRKDGVLWYVTAVNGELRKIVPEDVLHVKGLGFDGLAGYPLYMFARDSLGCGMAAQKFGAKYFANSTAVGGHIEFPGMLTEIAQRNLRDSFERIHQGLENSHRVAVLEEGAKYVVDGHNARQAQLIELLEFGYVEVSNWLGIPPHKLGYQKASSYASLEQENQAYLDEGLDPWLCNLEGECWDKLLTEEEKQRDSHDILFDRLMLERADTAARGEYFQKALTTGWMCRDEVRARENLNPLPDGEGQKFMTPLNEAIVGGPATLAEPPPPGDGPAEPPAGDGSARSAALETAARRAVADAAARCALRIATHAGRKADPEAWLAGGAVREHRETIEAIAGPALAIAAALWAPGIEPRAFAAALFARAKQGMDEAAIARELTELATPPTH